MCEFEVVSILKIVWEESSTIRVDNCVDEIVVKAESTIAWNIVAHERRIRACPVLSWQNRTRTNAYLCVFENVGGKFSLEVHLKIRW